MKFNRRNSMDLKKEIKIKPDLLIEIVDTERKKRLMEEKKKKEELKKLKKCKCGKQTNQ